MIEPGTLAQGSLGYLPEPSASWRMQVEKDRSSHFGGGLHGLQVRALRSQVLTLRTDEKKIIRAKNHNWRAYVLEYCHKNNKSLALVFTSWKKPRHINPSPEDRILLPRLFSADKRLSLCSFRRLKKMFKHTVIKPLVPPLVLPLVPP